MKIAVMPFGNVTRKNAGRAAKPSARHLAGNVDISNYIVDTMKTSIIRIGNSRGVRIPKALLEQSGLSDEVEMTVRDGALILSNPTTSRQGWEEAFAKGVCQGQDIPLHPQAGSVWDEDEWSW